MDKNITQREIKFRAWGFQNNKMRVVDHATFLANGDHLLWFYEKGKEKEPDFLFTYHEKYGKESTLMQYIEIKDINGKEIYEGDIVVCRWLAELGITELDCVAQGVVHYQPAIAAYIVEFDKPFIKTITEEGTYEEEQMQLREFSDEETISFEIVGNIYENAELLNQGENDERTASQQKLNQGGDA